MHKVETLLAASLLLSGAQTIAAPIVNGDFSQCDYSSWTTESVGGGTLDEQFSIVETAQGCSAKITIDDSPSFINLLYQEVDFSQASSAPFMFSYDFTVDSALTGQPSGSADYFAIGLGDGSGDLFDEQGNAGGFFTMPDINGPQQYQGSVRLADTFADVSGLSLELQLFSNFDAAPASITVNNLSIEQTSVPAPATAALLTLALLASGFARRSKEGDKA